MHNKIHSVISPLFRIKNADTETGWNVQILRSVWIISAEIRYLLSGQKKFQNKSKNIDEVYQSVFFRCIMFLSYRVTFLCNVLGQIHYTSESPVRYFFYEKVVKWCKDIEPSEVPAFIIFITDGENWDTNETNKIVKELSNYNMFVQFIGIGDESFNYLRSLDHMEGRKHDNTGFTAVKDMNKMTDEQLYTEILRQYKDWLNKK